MGAVGPGAAGAGVAGAPVSACGFASACAFAAASARLIAGLSCSAASGGGAVLAAGAVARLSEAGAGSSGPIRKLDQSAAITRKATSPATSVTPMYFGLPPILSALRAPKTVLPCAVAGWASEAAVSGLTGAIPAFGRRSRALAIALPAVAPSAAVPRAASLRPSFATWRSRSAAPGASGGALSLAVSIGSGGIADRAASRPGSAGVGRSAPAISGLR